MKKPKFQYSLRYLYAHLGEVVKSGEPFEITDHNKVVAVVTPKREDQNDRSAR